MAASDARPIPRKNTAYRLYFALRKNDGTLITSWTGADSEVSLDGASFTDCTNEATEIGTSGCGYIDLTSGEMNADSVVVKTTVTNTGAIPLVVTLFPEETGDMRADLVQISGDATAADNLEAVLDGTGGVTLAANMSGSIGSVTSGVTVSSNTDKTGYSLVSGPLDAAGVRSAIGLAAANLDTQLAALPSAAANADAVWDEALSGHAASGSAGAALTAAGSAADPWSTSVPGAYGSGTAGKILGEYLDAAISSRASQSSVDAVDDYIDTEVAAIKAKTDNLPPSPAAVSDIPTVAAIRAEIDSNSSKLASILADTSEIQADLADGGRLDLLIDGMIADLVKLKAAVYDSISVTGNVLTLSNGATQTIGVDGDRTTA